LLKLLVLSEHAHQLDLTHLPARPRLAESASRAC
jgi:hypothetical protein